MNEVILSRIRKEAYEQGYQDGKVEGYNLAGKALLPRSINDRVKKMNDDTISRQAAIDALTHFTNLSWDKLKTIYPMLTVIEELPSAERRGRWVYKSELYSYCGRPFYPKICSVCNGVFEYTTNYCPNCGAKMDEEENE